MSLCRGRCALAGAELPTPCLAPAGKEAAPTAGKQNMQQIEGVSHLLLVSCASGKDVVSFFLFGHSSAESPVLMVGVRLPMESSVFVNS